MSVMMQISASDSWNVGVASFSDLVELLLFQPLIYSFTIIDLTELFKSNSL